MPNKGTYKFSIDSLIAKYEFEPGLRDIFVEGDSDVKVIDEYTGYFGLRPFAAYSIDDVNVPAELVRPAYGSGNRGRVVALSVALSEELQPNLINVFCVADRDFECIDKSLPECGRLLLVDFSALESYGFTWEKMNAYFRKFFQVEVSEQVFQSIIKICRESFLIRAYKQSYARELSWAGLQNSLSLSSDDGIRFDRSSFLSRQLTSKGYHDTIVALETWLDSHLSLRVDDFRHWIHKDDFYEVLSWYLRSKRTPITLCNADVLKGLVFLTLSPDYLSQFNFFKMLADWVANGIRPLRII
ncbi:MAG: hypothetical protein H7Z12_15480 [Rhodospirillaceae bacterium]|nr:hypothetical protein [Rhodospirillales bacterium]